MESFNALVSILVPVYNRVNIITDTLSSALSQTYSNIEVVVVDNASTDGTWELISELSKKDGRLKIFRNEANLGPVRNWLRCVEKANGELGKILWSDDLISENFLEVTLPFLNNAEVGFVFTAANVFTSSPQDGVLHHAIGRGGVYSTESFIRGDINEDGYPVSPGCALFRMKDLQECLLLNIPNSVDSDFSMHAIGNDLLLFLLVANKYPKFAFVPEVLSFFRSHEGSISVASKNCKLPLHYNLARAHFVECYRPDLISKLNLTLRFHLFRFPDSKEFGVEAVSQFYTINKKASFSWMGFLLFVIRKFYKKYSPF